MGKPAPAWARLPAHMPARLRAYAPACPHGGALALAPAPVGARLRLPACLRLPAHARPCVRACLRVPAPAPASLPARLPARVPADVRVRGRACVPGRAKGRGRGPGGRFSTIYKCLRRTKQLFQSVSKHAHPPPRKKFSKSKRISLPLLAVYAMQGIGGSI